MSEQIKNEYKQEIEGWDWEALKQEAVQTAIMTASELTQDELELFDAIDEDGSIVGKVYIGTVFSLTPSGKYYTPFACGNVEPCPECGGDGHAREVCTLNFAVPCKLDILVDCEHCNATGKRYISELAELRGESYKECLTHFEKQVSVGWCLTENRPNTHYIYCAYCQGNGQTRVTCPTCDGLGSKEAYHDTLWREALDEVADSKGFWVESSEGNATDMLVARWVEQNERVISQVGGKRTLSLGKIDHLGNGRKSCLVELEINLEWNTKERRTTHHRQVNGYFSFSVVGRVWNHTHTNIYVGGQIVDFIDERFGNNEKVQRIVKLWKRWHLNDMQAGCVHQETGDYNDECIRHQVCIPHGYKYGTSWLVEIIPNDVISEIVDILTSN